MATNKPDEGAAQQPQNVAVTYQAQPGDPVTTTWHGLDFEHNKPVEVPSDHPMFAKSQATGLSQVDANPWFSTGDKKSQPKASGGEPKSPQDYFRYAIAWLGESTTSGSIESRWNAEEPMRRRVGWGSDDEDRIRPILQPKLDNLKKAERQMGS